MQVVEFMQGLDVVEVLVVLGKEMVYVLRVRGGLSRDRAIGAPNGYSTVRTSWAHDSYHGIALAAPSYAETRLPSQCYGA